MVVYEKNTLIFFRALERPKIPTLYTQIQYCNESPSDIQPDILLYIFIDGIKLSFNAVYST